MKGLAIVLMYIVLMWLILLRGRKNHQSWKVLGRYHYAHRGLHNSEKGIPENSLAAFRLAAENGYGAELDVHLTRDGQLAVIHDSSLLRTAGVDVKVSDLTSKELMKYRLEGTDERIPFLEEVVPIFDGVAPLIIELKVEKNTAALAKAVTEMMDEFDNVDYCIESFHPGAVRWLKKHRPEICRGQLSQNFLRGTPTGKGKIADFIMTHCLTTFLTKPDFIAYNHEHRNRLCLKIAKRVWQVHEFSWTVRTPEDMERCEDADCLIIFEHFEP